MKKKKHDLWNEDEDNEEDDEEDNEWSSDSNFEYAEE